MRALYLALCIVGTVVPGLAIVPWLARNGPDLGLLLSQALASPVAAFAWADVLVSGLALLCFIAQEQRARPVRGVVWPVLALFCVGVSLALPLYLFLREGNPLRAGDSA